MEDSMHQEKDSLVGSPEGAQGTEIQERAGGDDYPQALHRAMRALARREHSVVEVRRKLGSAGVTEAICEQVLTALQSDGSLSDERFAAEFVRSRIRKGYGPIRIRMDLVERGISDRLAEEHLTRAAEFWQQHAIEVCEKKFGSLSAEPAASMSGPSRTASGGRRNARSMGSRRWRGTDLPDASEVEGFSEADSGEAPGGLVDSSEGDDSREIAAEARRAERDRWNRCARFLSRRGFPADLIYRTLDGRLQD